MPPLPRGEHALYPLLVALLVLVLAAKPMVDLGLLPRGAMAVAMLLTIMSGLLGLAPQERRFRSLLVVTGVPAMGLQQGCSTLSDAEKVEEVIDATDGSAEAVLGE